MRPQEHGVRSVLAEALHHPVPKSRRGWLQFGWLLAMLFAVQLVTGILLSFYYQPSPDMAFESVKYILRDVSSGWLVRGLHHWAAEGMIALALLELLRVFFAGAYKGAGRPLWYLGMMLLALSFAFAFTGNLLPWDQPAYWSVVVALQGLESIPLVGWAIAMVLRGGEEVGTATLSRFNSIHILVLPWIGVGLVFFALWLLPRRKRDAGTGPEPEVRPFFPYHFLNWTMAALLMLGVLVLLAALLPPGLSGDVDLGQRPAGTEPPWYFRGLDQFLGLFQGDLAWMGWPLAALAGLAVYCVPILDRASGRNWRQRWPILLVGALFMAGALFLSLRGLP